MDFSPVIFWDVDAANIDWQKSSRFVIGRVVQYGTVKDWEKVKDLYGIEKIKSDMLEERDLDQRSLSFLSCILEVPKEEFKCYTTNLLRQEHFNF